MTRDPVEYPALAPPVEFIGASRSAMGGIDFDPYCTRLNNRLVCAKRYLDRDELTLDDIVSREWDIPDEGRVLVAPPIGAVPNRRLISKTLKEYRQGRVKQACVLISNNETMTRAPWIWDFPICIPFSRLKPRWWDDDTDKFRPISCGYWSFVVFLPPCEDTEDYQKSVIRFYESFAPLGRVVFNQMCGDTDWKDAYKDWYGRPFSLMR